MIQQDLGYAGHRSSGEIVRLPQETGKPIFTEDDRNAFAPFRDQGNYGEMPSHQIARLCKLAMAGSWQAKVLLAESGVTRSVDGIPFDELPRARFNAFTYKVSELPRHRTPDYHS